MDKKMNTTRRYGDTNILKLHELHEKCVNFYKISKHELTKKNTRHNTKTRIVKFTRHILALYQKKRKKIKILFMSLPIFVPKH